MDKRRAVPVQVVERRGERILCVPVEVEVQVEVFRGLDRLGALARTV